MYVYIYIYTHTFILHINTYTYIDRACSGSPCPSPFLHRALPHRGAR